MSRAFFAFLLSLSIAACSERAKRDDAGTAPSAMPLGSSTGAGGAGSLAPIETPAGPEARFSLKIAAPAVWVRAGQSQTLDVQVERDADFSQSIALELVNLPAGLSAQPVTLGATESSAQVIVHATAEVLPGAVATARLRAAAGVYVRYSNVTVGVLGDPGTLDVSFAGGFVGMAHTGSVSKLIPSEKGILVAGNTGAGRDDNDIFVSRFSMDGELDPTFGTAGVTTIDIGGFTDGTNALAVDKLGRIWVTGAAYVGKRDDAAKRNTVIVRLRSDGALDASFGNAGVLTFDASGANLDDIGVGTFVDASGAVWLAASCVTGVLNQTWEVSEPALYRFNDAGEPDMSFGTRGRKVFPMKGEGWATASAMVNGNIYIGGADGINFTDSYVLRLDAQGAVNAGYGAEGVALRNCAYAGYARTNVADMVAAADGSIIVACAAYDPYLHAIRFDPSGKPDASFGDDGIAAVRLTEEPYPSGAWTTNLGIALAPNGSVYVVGTTPFVGSSSPGDSTVIVRVNPAGRADTTFAPKGFVQLRFAVATREPSGKLYDAATAAWVQPDGRLIVGGYFDTADGAKPYLARFWP